MIPQISEQRVVPVDSLKLDGLAKEYCQDNDLEPTHYLQKLEVESLLSKVRIYGESQVLLLFQNHKNIKCAYFTLIGWPAISALIKEGCFLLADFFIQQGATWNSNLLDIFPFNSFSLEQQRRWLLAAQPISSALNYTIKMNWQEMFEELFKASSRDVQWGLDKTVEMAILNKCSWALTQVLNKYPWAASEQHHRLKECDIQTTKILIEKIERPSYTSIYFIAKNQRFCLDEQISLIEMILQKNPNILNEEDLFLAIEQEKILVFLLKKVKQISPRVLGRFVSNSDEIFAEKTQLVIIDYLIRVGITVKTEDETDTPEVVDSLAFWNSNKIEVAEYVLENFPEKISEDVLSYILLLQPGSVLKKALKRCPQIKISKNHLRYAKKPSHFHWLLKLAKFAIDDELFENAVEAGAVESLHYLLRNNPAYALKSKILSSALCDPSDPIILLLLESNVEVDTDVLAKALTLDEPIAERVLTYIHRKAPHLFHEHALGEINHNFSDEFFFKCVSCFSQIRIDKLLRSFEKMTDDRALALCNVLMGKGCLLGLPFLRAAMHTKKAHTFKRLFEQSSEEILTFDEIPKNQQILDLLTPHVETGRVKWSKSVYKKYGAFTSRELEMLLLSCKKDVEKSCYPKLVQYQRLYFRLFNFLMTHNKNQKDAVDVYVALKSFVEAACEESESVPPVLFNHLSQSTSRYAHMNLFEIIYFDEIQRLFESLIGPGNQQYLDHMNSLDLSEFKKVHKYLGSLCWKTKERESHLVFYSFVLIAYYGDKKSIIEALQKFIIANPQNPTPIASKVFEIGSFLMWNEEKNSLVDELYRAMKTLSRAVDAFHYCDLKVYSRLYTSIEKLCMDGKEDPVNTGKYASMLASLFSSEHDALTYLAHFKAHHHSRQPVHDACLFHLPKTTAWNSKLWSSLIIKHKYSQAVMQLLAFADAIEGHLYGPMHRMPNRPLCVNDSGIRSHFMKELSKIVPSEWPPRTLKKSERTKKILAYCEKHLPNDFKAWKEKREVRNKVDLSRDFNDLFNFMILRRDIKKRSLNQLLHLVLELEYGDVEKALFPLAWLCVRKGVARSDFDKILQYLKTPKPLDWLPDVVITDSKYPKYQLVKMAADDPLAFILGHLTGCCQSVGGLGEKPALHGALSPFGAFLVLKNVGEPDSVGIKAQAWVSVAEPEVGVAEPEMVMDSIEYNSGVPKEMIDVFFKKCAEEALKMNPLLKRVVVGGGGATPDCFKKKEFLLAPPYSKIIGFSKIGYDSQDERYLLAQSRGDRPLDLSAYRWIETTGTDTFIKHKQIRTLALDYFSRRKFWNEHPNANQLLMQNRKNPLIEEGYYSPKHRDRVGELFLTVEAIEKLIRHLFSPTPPRLIDNREDTLHMHLKHLGEGSSLSFIITSGIHAFALHVRNEQGSMYAFIVDSSVPSFSNKTIVDQLFQNYPSIKIMGIRDVLQHDYYSCGVFAISALRFFAKEGNSLFSNIDLSECCEHSPGCFYLNRQQIPPPLLKFAQYPITIETHGKKILNGLVSKGKTLQQHIFHHKVTVESRTYSTAAIKKNYRLMRLLEQRILAEQVL